MNEFGPDGNTAIKIAATNDNLLVLHEMLKHQKEMIVSNPNTPHANINVFGLDGLVCVNR